NKSTEYTKSTKSTTIRINISTKEKLANLDFVKKDTYDEILLKLMEFYEKNKKRAHESGKNQ
ncbi:hypothetical protein KY339_01005, partial [Candidatus Woesearchaeota archaeon]|nr:hypothetical protein [Candidatus Woesearchaeota archaeon]